MAEPGLKIEEVFKKVRIAVREKTKGEQTPWESTSLTGDFYPAGEKPSASATAAALPAVQPAQPHQLALAKPEPQPALQYEDADQRLIRTFKGHTWRVRSVAFSPDGRTALSGGCGEEPILFICDTGSLMLWDTASGRELRSFAGHSSEVGSVAFSPDGRLALSSDNSTIRLWDIASGRELHSFAGALNNLTTDVASAAISPDGRTMLSGHCDQGSRHGCLRGSLILWEIASGRELRRLDNSANSVRSVAFSPDGRFAFSNTAQLWDIASGRELPNFKGHAFYSYSVAFSPSGRTVLSGSDKTLILWDVASGRELHTFSGHAETVNSVAFSPDGRFALSGSYDKTLKLWDIVSGGELRSFAGHTSAVSSVAISPDGRFALSGSLDDTLKLWDISEWTQPQEARR